LGDRALWLSRLHSQNGSQIDCLLNRRVRRAEIISGGARLATQVFLRIWPRLPTVLSTVFWELGATLQRVECFSTKRTLQFGIPCFDVWTSEEADVSSAEQRSAGGSGDAIFLWQRLEPGIESQASQGCARTAENGNLPRRASELPAMVAECPRRAGERLNVKVKGWQTRSRAE